MNKYLFLICLLFSFFASNVTQAEDILWQEDFSSYEADAVPIGGTYKYVCVEGTGLTKIYTENLAGGTAPELLINKYDSRTHPDPGSFSVTIPMNGKSGEMTLSFKRNSKSLNVTATGATLGKSIRTGNTDEYPVTVAAGTKEVTFTFTAGSANVRFDDAKLYQGLPENPTELTSEVLVDGQQYYIICDNGYFLTTKGTDVIATTTPPSAPEWKVTKKSEISWAFSIGSNYMDWNTATNQIYLSSANKAWDVKDNAYREGCYTISGDVLIEFFGDQFTDNDFIYVNNAGTTISGWPTEYGICNKKDDEICMDFLFFQTLPKQIDNLLGEEMTFDFSKPSTLGIVPSSEVEGEVNVSGPIVKGQVTATMTDAVEVTMGGPSYFLEIGRAGTLEMKTKSPDKIRQIEFGNGCDVSHLVPNCGTLTGNVWTGDTDCVIFSVEDVRNAFADITAVNVWYISNTFDCVDGEVYSNNKKQLGQTINYTRAFKNADWQALYVPFSITYDEWKDDFDIAEIINFIEYDDDDNGTVDRTCLVAIKKASGSTLPNTPYLIRAKVAGNKMLTLTDKTLEAAVSNSIECSSTKNVYTFTGTYSKVTDMYANGYYALSGGSLQTANSASVVLSPQRWYMSITPKSGGYAATRAQTIKILVDGEEGVQAPSISPKGEGSVAYDITGRGVKRTAKGVSIVNGKKIIR